MRRCASARCVQAARVELSGDDVLSQVCSMQWPKPPGRSLMSVRGNAAPRGMTAHDRIRLTGPSAELFGVTARDPRRDATTISEISPASGTRRSPDCNAALTIWLRIRFIAGYTQSSLYEDTLVDRRSPAFRPCVGALCAAGVGKADRLVFMPRVEDTIPRQQCRQTDGREFGSAGLRAKSSHPGTPAAPDSREEDQRPGKHNSGAPMLCRVTIPRPGRIVRIANYRRPQSVPRTPLAALPLNPILIL